MGDVHQSPNSEDFSDINSEPRPLGPPLWDWKTVERVLVVRLRSIGDTVLATPSLFALKRFLPHAAIDILVEDWVAPVLESHPYIDNVITVRKGHAASRALVARRLRANRYDVVYNFHGGTTATLLTRATGARHRVGFATYQYARLHNHLAPSSSALWRREKTHSAEQQLALLGWTGVPVSDRPRTRLAVSPEAGAAVTAKLVNAGLNDRPFVVVHPAAAFATKQWSAQNFGQVAQELSEQGLPVVVITTPSQTETVAQLQRHASAPVVSFNDLSLPEVTALLAHARLFVGNDSGIAHMAAAVETPAVVIFGSSNTAHWRPWVSDAPGSAAEIVFEEMECRPCHGYFCEKFAQPECILRVPVNRVMAAIERVLRESAM